jgi:hypothetical protein
MDRLHLLELAETDGGGEVWHHHIIIYSAGK